MTRLVVTADAQADTFAVLADPEAKAGAPVAERYARRFVLQSNASHPDAAERRTPAGAWGGCALRDCPALSVDDDYALGDDTVALLRVLHGRRRITRETTQRG